MTQFIIFSVSTVAESLEIYNLYKKDIVGIYGMQNTGMNNINTIKKK